MYIKLDKKNEDATCVVYNFSTTIPDRSHRDDYGEVKWHIVVVHGACKFNKINENFELEERSDSYFFMKNNREIIKIRNQLIFRNRENLGFPAIIDIATG